MLVQAVGRSSEHAHRVEHEMPAGAPPAAGQIAVDECLDFVRFCYRRRAVGWPALYDEMCAVAARGLYRGLGYAELAERGICFSLTELPRLVTLTQRVVAEERRSHEPPADPAPLTLSVVPAGT